MSFKFACYFPGEKPLFMRIEPKSNAYVQDLLDAIAAKLHSESILQSVRTCELQLFKTDLPLNPRETRQSRALEWLHSLPSNSHLDEASLLKKSFPDGPHPPEDEKLDIIVANLEVLQMSNELGDPYAAYKRKIKKALNKGLDSLSSLPSPSEAIKNPEKVFGEEGCCIHFGRPGGAPAAIFNPVLAALQRNLGNLDQVDVSEYEASVAASYIRCAVQFYDNENARQDMLEDLVNHAIGGPPAGGWGFTVGMGRLPFIRPGYIWWHGDFVMGALELKNTLGLGGDALSQAIIDYGKIISRNECKRFREYCNFPCVLIGITANRIEIAIAVCVGAIYVTKLLTLDLSLDFHASDNIIRLARVFKILECHLLKLKEYYRSIKTLLAAPPTLSCLFPSPTLIDPSMPMPKLTYREFLARDGRPTPEILDLGATTTVMYTAILDDTKEKVIVKFTARYNEKAHRLLAEAQLAPKLHFCERVVGDLYMVVMEYVEGKSVWQLRREKTPIPEVVATKVEKAVHLLHAQGIVFGDLRCNNVLVVGSGADAHAVLVDFDWAGEHGKGRYPATLNPDIVGDTWHVGVLPYHFMRKEHDLWLLENLKALCV